MEVQMKTLLILVLLAAMPAQAYSKKDFAKAHKVCSVKANKTKPANRFIFMADCVARLGVK